MNLLPEEEKKNIRHEYLFRFFTVVSYFLSLSFLLGAFAVFPYFLSARTELDRTSEKTEALNVLNVNVSTTTEKIVADFSRFSDRIKLLIPVTDSQNLAPIGVLTNILAVKPEGVQITSFSYIGGAEVGGIKIVVLGVASNRDSLLLFKKELSATGDFSLVDLPVSNFSEKTDIEFTLTLTLEVKNNEEKQNKK